MLNKHEYYDYPDKMLWEFISDSAKKNLLNDIAYEYYGSSASFKKYNERN